MTPNPQEGTPRDMWMTHDGMVHLEDMLDEHVINAFKTCMRHSNPKADDVYRELASRNIEYRVKKVKQT